MERMPGRQPVRGGAASSARRTLVLLAGLAIGPLAHAAARPIFPNPGYPVGEIPIALASGDFNRDGIRDIAVVNRDSEDLSILIGLGGGAFRPEQRYAMPDIPVDVVTEDLDADGADDLVVAFPRLDGVGVMRSGGAGHFGPVTLVPTGDSPSALATGDFNSDGHADLAVAHFFGETTILLGTGAGSFGAPRGFPAGIYPSDIAVADLNRDGRLDLLVANAGSNNLGIYLGTGGGLFGAMSAVPTAAGSSFFHPVQLITHDLDEDGIPDILFVNFSNTDEINAVETLRGRGDGSFEPGGFTTQLADGQVGVGIGDFDGDGHDDLALTFRHGAICCFHHTGMVYRGSGHGAFDLAESFETGIAPVALLQGDFDLDGKADIAALSHYPGLVTVLLGQGREVLGVRVPSIGLRSAFPFVPQDLTAGDLDADGHPDLVMSAAPESSLSILYGLGDAAFAARQTLATSGPPSFSLAADVDGDGRRDIVVAVDGPMPGLYLHRGLGGRAFAPATLIAPVPGTREIQSLNLDHDDRLDLAVITQGEPREILLVRNLGNGGFAPPVPLSINVSPRMFVAGDLDGDGVSELAIVSESDEVLFLRGLGDGAFSSPLALEGSAFSVQLVDMNGDGHLDLVGGGGSGSVWLGRSDGSFGPPILASGIRSNYGLVASDFDGDGIRDIAFIPTGEEDGSVGIQIGSADGTFGDPAYCLPQVPVHDSFASALRAADFDQDGRTDLLLAFVPGFNDLRLSVLLNQGPFPNHPPQAEATAASRLECSSPAGAAVLLDGRASTDPDSTPGTADDIAAYEWFEDFALPARRLVGQGALLQTTLALGDHALTLRVTDQAGATATAEVVVRVVDTAAPYAALRLTPDRLWPANHKLVDVQALLTVSDVCGGTRVVLQSVTSSEPDGSGDANNPVTPGDISGAAIGAPDFAFRLRAERLGAGTGRIYTVRYLVTDASGNSTVALATVTVPHDMGTSPGPSPQRGGRHGGQEPKPPRPRS